MVHLNGLQRTMIVVAYLWCGLIHALHKAYTAEIKVGLVFWIRLLFWPVYLVDFSARYVYGLSVEAWKKLRGE